MKRILITPGEPAGIGPDITIQIAQQPWKAELIAIADPQLLSERAKQLALPLQLHLCDLTQKPTSHLPGTLKIFKIPLVENVIAGQLNPANASYIIKTLEAATTFCAQNKADAIVTGPVHKETMNRGKYSFTGHTEFFAQVCHVPQTVMLFVVNQSAISAKPLKIALATTHLPLEQVSPTITKKYLKLMLTILREELIKKFGIVSPHIFVCGLNPHAGEGGYLGKEEIEIMTPLLEQLRTEGHRLTGPLPADTIFTQKYLKEADAILAMYHDQALPLVKYIGFGQAVNVTLGLPFIRTSVDHGTAIDLAGTPEADSGSLAAAIDLAINLSSTQPSLSDSQK